MIVRAASSRAEALLAARRVLVVAHRGDSGVAPENTLPAFRSALALGVDMVEFDYHHAADGVPVVIHDATLMRTTDAAARWGPASLAVADRTMTDLATLDAGGWFAAQFVGTRLSTVVEAIDAIHAGGCVALVERKAGDAATLIAALGDRGRLGNTIVQAFDWAFLAECRRLAPGLVVGALGRDEISAEKLDQVVATGANFIGWADRDLTAAGIELAHRRGLKVFDFTVDDEARAVELIDMGLDAIITNVPGRMQSVVAQRASVATQIGV